MKSYTEHLWMETRKRIEFVNITHDVERIAKKSGVKEGLVLVNPMHITASVYVNDAEDGLIEDIQTLLEKLVPNHRHPYKHNLTGEDNASAHLRRMLIGREAVVALTNGSLDFGPWEAIYYAEFDGQRRKRVLVKVIGE